VGNLDLTGLLAGIELVKDKGTGEAFPASMNMGSRVAQASQRHNLLHRHAGNRIAFAPAYIISEDEIVEIGVRLRKSLDEVHGEVSGN
jgi:adenosylmethionine-8-amino-7-oxononanoate aminotransferase